MTSVFLELPATRWVASNDLAFAIRDGFPVTEGHTLVIPKRLVATWFETSLEEQRAMLDLVEVVKRQLDETLKPDGYNVGFNHGEAAGQTVMHLHVHLIPRYRGDMDDPRGGVRHVIPWKGNYKRSATTPLSTGGERDPFLRRLLPLFAGATDVWVVAAFVQDSGLEVLRESVFSVLERGGRVRVVTGDYLNITQAEALKRMLDWQGAFAPEGEAGTFEVRVVETRALPGSSRSFHPKSWRFEGPGGAVAFVGSSNVSYAALKTGVEWNLRIERAQDARGYGDLAAAFDHTWATATPLTFAWVKSYAGRARITARDLPPGEQEEEPPVEAPPPHEIQRQALDALGASHDEGRSRALVVMATGLGKTLLAAIYAERLRTQRPDGSLRILFVAHRRELLVQAAETFRRVLRRSLPDFTVGWFAERRAELDADLVVASVAKLSRPEHLAELEKRVFDYVVIDEVHHAHAQSYRRLIAHLNGGFVLGLTATPDRADEGDVLGLFDDNLPYRADLGVGIEAGWLVPFAYFGVKDVVDYANIPWRNRRFDPEQLARAVQTQQRMQLFWEAWNEHRGERTLVFCCSVAHAEFVCGWLREKGVRVVAVFGGSKSADREHSLRALHEGELDAVCAVDLFNEGVDLPCVDRVVMLRPTESPVLFLQQLGRGLRVAPGKEILTVIDFVGNHRVFLERLRVLLSFGGGRADLARFLRTGQQPDLPPGCKVDVDLEAVDLLERLLPAGASTVERAYRELRAYRDERPTVGELYRMGYTPSTLRDGHGSWFEFVDREGDLDERERAALIQALAWFRHLETTPMTKSFKMVVLQVLIEQDALESGMDLSSLASRSLELLNRSPELRKDLEGVKELGNLAALDGGRFASYWRKNPIAAWCTGSGRAKKWFAVDSERFVPRLPIAPGHGETFAALTRELVDYRLAQYRRRIAADVPGESFRCKVLWNKRDPILKLPSRKVRPDIPENDLRVRLPDGRVWLFRLMKEFCNVARPVGLQRNQLPDLMRRWFGLSAGRPGTAFRVRFFRSAQGWCVEPEGQVVELFAASGVTAYPSLRAAAGAVHEGVVAAPDPEVVALPLRTRADGVFAVRATGDSMDGGKAPIRDGDWLVFKHARGVGLGAVEGRVALLQTDVGSDHGFQIKRVVRDGARWMLRSDNPDRPDFDATEATVPIATLVEVFRPEDLAPRVGTVLDADALLGSFGIAEAPKTGRFGVHLLLVLGDGAELVARDRVTCRVADLRPGETAFVLAPAGDTSWRYCGVARTGDTSELWEIPEVDSDTWRRFGSSRAHLSKE